VGVVIGWTWHATPTRTGTRGDAEFPYAWRYRDYVIDSFNNDKPYDQFIKEQLAGDEEGNGKLRRSSTRAGTRESSSAYPFCAWHRSPNLAAKRAVTSC